MITRRGLFAACVAAGVTACVGDPDRDGFSFIAIGEYERGEIVQPIRIDTFEEFVHHFGRYEPEKVAQAAAVCAGLRSSPGFTRIA